MRSVAELGTAFGSVGRKQSLQPQLATHQLVGDRRHASGLDMVSDVTQTRVRVCTAAFVGTQAGAGEVRTERGETIFPWSARRKA